MIRTNLPLETKIKKFDKNDARYKTDRFAEGAFYRTSKNMVAILGWELAGVLTNLIDQYNLWLKYGKCKDGSFFCTIEKQAQILKFTEDKIRKCKKILTQMGLIHTIMKGLPPKEYYYIDMDKFEEMERNHINSVPPENERDNPAENGINYPNENGSDYPTENRRDIYNENKNNENKIKTKAKKAFSTHSDSSYVNEEYSSEELEELPKTRKTLSAKQNSPIKGQAIEWAKVSKRFAQFMEEKLDIHISTKEHGGAVYGSIRKLNIEYKIPVSRMLLAIDWLFEHCDDEFVPSITNIHEFCYKFSKLEAAMKRQDKPAKSKSFGYMGGDGSCYAIEGASMSPEEAVAHMRRRMTNGQV